MNRHSGISPLAATTIATVLLGGSSVRRLLGRLYPKSSSLATTSVYAFSVMVAGAVIGYLTQVGTARIVGAGNFGTYAYVLAWVTLLGYLSTLGFHVSLLRLVPAYLVRKDWPLIGGVLSFAHWGVAAAGISLAVIAGLAVQWLYQDDPDLATTFLIGIVAAPFIALRLVGAAAVRAFGGIITSMVPERIVRDSIALAFLGAAVLGGLIAPDAATAMWAMLASAIVTLGLVRYFLRRARPAEVGIGLRVYAARDWIRPTLPLTVIMAADIVMSRSGVLVLGLQGDTLGAGIFFVAFSVAQITALPRMAVASVFAPMVSDRYSRGDATGLQALSAKAACVSLLGTAVVALPFLLYPAALLSWFGPEFVAGAPVVVILLVGQLLAAAAGPQQHLLTMTGHERAGATFMASSAVANFLGALLLVGPFGMTGAAVAVSGSVVVWNVAMALFLRRRLGLRPGLAVALIRRSSVGATIHEGDPDLGTAPPRPDQV